MFFVTYVSFLIAEALTTIVLLQTKCIDKEILSGLTRKLNNGKKNMIISLELIMFCIFSSFT